MIFLDTETQETPCLINFGYTGKNYNVRLLIEILIFHNLTDESSNIFKNQPKMGFRVKTFFL